MIKCFKMLLYLEQQWYLSTLKYLLVLYLMKQPVSDAYLFFCQLDGSSSQMPDYGPACVASFALEIFYFELGACMSAIQYLSL